MCQPVIIFGFETIFYIVNLRVKMCDRINHATETEPGLYLLAYAYFNQTH